MLQGRQYVSATHGIRSCTQKNRSVEPEDWICSVMLAIEGWAEKIMVQIRLVIADSHKYKLEFWSTTIKFAIDYMHFEAG